MNNFNYEKLPEKKDFCGRKSESKLLKAFILDGKNVVIFGDRRYGKTSLIEHCFRDLNKTGPLYAFSDLFSCTTSLDVAVEIYKAVYKALPFNIEQTMKEFKRIFSRMTLEIKTGETGIKASPKLNSRDFDELLADALLGADRICEKHGKKMVIALDEFQQIAELDDKNIDAVFRQYMQRLKHVSFIFSGSKKSILSGLFIDKKKPLYNMASSIEVGGLEVNTFYKYCNKRLHREMAKKDFDHLYERVRGQTKLILQVCWWLNISEQDTCPIAANEVQETLDMLIDEKHSEFKLIFNALTSLQRKAIKFMVNQPPSVAFFDANTLHEARLTRQQLSQSLKALIANATVDKIGTGIYRLNDVYFGLWCHKNIKM